MRWWILLAIGFWVQPARAETVTMLSAGAFRAVVEAVAPGHTAATGDRVIVLTDTAGGLARRIAAGEAFDLAVITPGAINDLAAKGKVIGPAIPLARVGIGVAVRTGAALPDISTEAAFKASLLAVRRIAMIDPAAGGSSGIYLAGLFERLGIADQVKGKLVLQAGGYVAEQVAQGKADIALHQISELLPVSGITLVGPLPPSIQNETIYAAGVAAGAPRPAAERLLARLRAADMVAVLAGKGMLPAK